MKQILFNPNMVRAILNSHKTVTRRVVKISGWKIIGNGERTGFGAFWFDAANDHTRTTISVYLRPTAPAASCMCGRRGDCTTKSLDSMCTRQTNTMKPSLTGLNSVLPSTCPARPRGFSCG